MHETHVLLFITRFDFEAEIVVAKDFLRIAYREGEKRKGGYI
jgi:hypothetical protein